jgi:integration host factor subunit beta
MIKSELIPAINKKYPGMKQKEIETIVDIIFDLMADELVKEGRVEIRGFGSFSVRYRKARTARNPKTGEPVDVPAKKIPFFTVGKELKARVDRSVSNQKTEP